MRHPALVALVVVIASCIGSSAASAVEITIGVTSSGVRAAATDSTDPPFATFDGIIVTELPASGEAYATEGATSARTTFSLSNDLFDFVFDNIREAGPGGASARSIAEIYFIPSADAAYSVSGAYSSEDPDGRLTSLEVRLFDWTTLSNGFYNLQESTRTPGESFVLGQLGGDSRNQLYGSATGTLVGGHQYSFSFVAGVGGGIGPVPNSARGTGFVTLAFVPEPSLSLLLIGGGVTLAGVARRSRKRAGRG